MLEGAIQVTPLNYVCIRGLVLCVSNFSMSLDPDMVCLLVHYKETFQSDNVLQSRVWGT